MSDVPAGQGNNTFALAWPCLHDCLPGADQALLEDRVEKFRKHRDDTASVLLERQRRRRIVRAIVEECGGFPMNQAWTSDAMTIAGNRGGEIASCNPDPKAYLLGAVWGSLPPAGQRVPTSIEAFDSCLKAGCAKAS